MLGTRGFSIPQAGGNAYYALMSFDRRTYYTQNRMYCTYNYFKYTLKRTADHFS